MNMNENENPRNGDENEIEESLYHDIHNLPFGYLIKRLIGHNYALEPIGIIILKNLIFFPSFPTHCTTHLNTT